MYDEDDFAPFLGPHDLSGVYFDSIPDGLAEWQVMRFILDREKYEAVEGDGGAYNSTALQEVRKADFSIPSVMNVFPSFPVFGRMYLDNDCVVLHLVNPLNNKVVLEFGTCDVGGYGHYPGFVAEFHPENMQ